MGGPDDRIDAKVAHVVAAGRGVGVYVEPVTFSTRTATAADAARAVGCDVGQIVKSLVFEADGRTVLLLVSGKNRVDETKAAAVLGVGSLVKADAFAAKIATGYSIGATPPLGLATDLPILMDDDLLAYDRVWASAGRPDSVFEIDPHALADATRARVCSLKQD